jgi:hypothetical protein
MVMSNYEECREPDVGKNAQYRLTLGRMCREIDRHCMLQILTTVLNSSTGEDDEHIVNIEEIASTSGNVIKPMNE